MPTNTPNLITVNDVLTFLATCRPHGDDSKATDHWLDRVGSWAVGIGWLLIVTTLGVAYHLGRQAPLSSDAKHVLIYTLLCGYGFFGLRIVALICVLWRNRRQWRRASIDETISRDEGHARTLLGCSDLLLNYSKDWLKRRSDRRERTSGVLIKDLGIIPAVALVYSAYLAWQTFDLSLKGLTLQGIKMDAFSQMAGTFFWVGLLTAVLGVLAARLAVARYAYQMDLIDVALKLKAFAELDRPSAEEAAPTDNG